MENNTRKLCLMRPRSFIAASRVYALPIDLLGTTGNGALSCTHSLFVAQGVYVPISGEGPPIFKE